MKKSLIALAVAGAMTAPMIAQADATLYGGFRVGIASTSNNGTAKTDGDLDLVDTSSRIGIKGDVDLGSDTLKGLYHAEWQANCADCNDQDTALKSRLHYIGMKGDFGKVTFGKQYHPHYLWINAPTNIFNPGDGAYGERFNLGNNGAGLGHLHKRTPDTVAYTSPVMSGVQVVAGIVLAGGLDDSAATGDDIDAYNIAARFVSGGLTAAISYGDADVGLEAETLGLAAKYKVDAIEVMAKYETQEEKDAAGAKTSDEDVIEVAARYTVDGVAVYGRYADYSQDVGNTDLSQFGFGVSKKMGKGKVYLEHVNNDSDDTNGDRTIAGYHVSF